MRRSTQELLSQIPREDLERRIIQMGHVEIDRDAPVRPADTSSREISLRVRKLNADFTCPICLGIMRETMTVMECLHRFCKDCIELSIRMGRKQCPSCRTKVPSRRNLRRDVAFDSLILQVYPDIDKATEEQELETKRVIQGHNHKAYADSVRHGTKVQDVRRKTRVALGSQPEGEHERMVQVESKREELIWFSMYPDTEAKGGALPHLQRRFLRCPGSAQIRNLKTYLGIKFQNNGPYCIAVKSNGQRRVLQPVRTLDELERSYGVHGKPLELFYSLEQAS
ncbi:hypothetical protein AAMO2058_000880500 [Amorphochlora amoebiformis]|uniref:RING-type E3 ubiquitin transferase n=1 Tax=Amorphochlora amoebiformis TaxID=1561963 RepID=A0A7S0DIX7_9EUKA|mmetsp:Transcript_30139/g.48313  ORF Transcript_30139/g.48313 Transcript_30139/m.48313 type:complete len:282 (+) Transcript_30139:31-876(+)